VTEADRVYLERIRKALIALQATDPVFTSHYLAGAALALEGVVRSKRPKAQRRSAEELLGSQQARTDRRLYGEGP
jgi:hypothetical protein